MTTSRGLGEMLITNIDGSMKTKEQLLVDIRARTDRNDLGHHRRRVITGWAP